MKHLRRRTRAQWTRDLLLWLLLSAVIAAMGADPVTDATGFAVRTGPLVALAGAAVLAGRPWPLAAVLLLLPFGPWRFDMGLATSTLVWPEHLPHVKIIPFQPVTLFVVWYAYLAGRRMRGTGPALAAFALLVVIGAGLVVARGAGLGLWITVTTGLLAVYAVPYLLGLLRRRLLQQREQARLSAAARARLRERARIARDMHDSLGHDLALIAVRAAGLEMAPGLDPAQVRAAGELRVAAAEATERLRQIIGLLRDDDEAGADADAGPPLAPVGEDVAALVERARASGMPVTLRRDPSVPAPALARAVVQEGLTNAAKHAPGAPVTVLLSPRRVVVRNGPPRSRPAAVPGGLGLTGLDERVRLAGGTMTAGPSGDGYELAVELP
ncbi:signal transduction histidine kinase [Nonomuraea muscovyensis]|uniref:histidine kinase n=1 Tax=Nonomuraea muscovyensis TaxID=1124761 RepID=A0A7X0F363_9ACTN|nr:histidine kinase [Nonomuraea muscovyensis]MBB6351800.1 signal transduction histidine kinase [Nonomuraea muscovyensis]